MSDINTDLLGTQAEQIEKDLKENKQPVIVLDVDNLLYSCAKQGNSETNYERVSQIGMMDFLKYEFGLGEGEEGKKRSALLRERLKLEGIGNGSTIAGIYALTHERIAGEPLKDGIERASKAIEILCSKDTAAIDAMLATKEAFRVALTESASPAFTKRFDGANLVKRFGEHAWRDDPKAEDNMTIEEGVADAINALHDAGAIIYAHSNSANIGVVKILKEVMGEDYAKVFGERDHRVYGVDQNHYFAKPHAQSYESVNQAIEYEIGDLQQVIGVSSYNGHATFFFDDSVKNCVTAKKQGHYDHVFRKVNRSWNHSKDGENWSRHPEGNPEDNKKTEAAGVTVIPDELGRLAQTLTQLATLIAQCKDKGADVVATGNGVDGAGSQNAEWVHEGMLCPETTELQL